MMDLNKTAAILSILNLKGIGPSFLKKNKNEIEILISKRDHPMDILLPLFKEKYNKEQYQIAISDAQQIIETCSLNNIGILNFYDEDYPKNLKENNKYPIIYYIGNIPRINQIIGIIGSREATEKGKIISQRVGEYFVQRECYILNGLARGIDQASFSGSDVISKTIGVVPGGLDYINSPLLSGEYKENADRIFVGGGCLISSFAPNVKQDQFKVVEYCELQAELSSAMILVQSKLDGGSRFTIKPFAQLKRKLGIINGSVYDNDVHSYEANNAILNKKREGISQFTGIKHENIMCDLIGINTREDYDEVIREN
ncbi:MAG TPA: DNA-processing protein DprA [Saprospiraceae bacterium]|nr:DNA-processing protein DprA [Saprospiraceae bacterium]